MLKIATDDAKISCRNAVASYICIANCAILFALDLVLRRPETSATANVKAEMTYLNTSTPQHLTIQHLNTTTSQLHNT